jgi:hypothetical protein
MIFTKEVEKSTLKFTWKHKRTWITKAIHSKRTVMEVSQYPTSYYIIQQ